MANDYYDIEIAGISARAAASGARMQGLFANLNRAVNELAEAQPAGIPTEERGVLLAFEELFLESLNRTAWLLHERGDLGAARECLELVRRARDLVQSTIDT
jgi:hypothetical protein